MTKGSTPAHGIRFTRASGLTLLELLLSMALLTIVMIIIASAISTMQNTWVRLREKSDEYRGARMALDGMTRHLQQATLAPRWVWDQDPATEGKNYKRESDLHFICGPAKDLLESGQYCGDAVFFQGPFGEPGNGVPSSTGQTLPEHEQLTDALSAWGYFVEFGTDAGERPAFLGQERERLPPRRRFRLMEFRQPTSDLTLFKLDASKDPPSAPLNDRFAPASSLHQWFREPMQAGNLRARHVAVLAENVIACVITPFDPKLSGAEQYSIAPNRTYDSREGQGEQPPTAATLKRLHHLPPALRLTVVITSEESWRRMSDAEVDNTASKLRTAVNIRFRNAELLDQDLDALEGEMNRIKMGYRIFTTNLRMPEQ